MQTMCARSPAGATPCRPRALAKRVQHGSRRTASAVRAHGNGASYLDAPIELENGAPVSGPSLAVTVNGMKLPNPFVVASGPPGTNYTVMRKAFQDGWGAVICKTLNLNAEKIHNVTPRYARMRAPDGTIVGWENIELISDRPFEVMLEELAKLKQEFPDRVLIASIMETYDKGAWEEITGRCAEVGVDGFEINFSCPHGMPELKMGMAMGQNPDMVQEVCSWVSAASELPVWAKMTPNITDITVPARSALTGGAAGVAAINTIQSIMGVNLDTLRPEPSVEGHSTPGGYSCKAVKPIALAKCAAVAKMLEEEGMAGKTLSGIGGVERGGDAAEFLLLGASSVQVCTGIMIHGHSMVKNLCGGLQQFMHKSGFNSIDDFRGHALQFVTTHGHLYDLQQDALQAKRAARLGLSDDAGWSGEGFVKEAETMVSN